jgi:putative ABC transport system permease protein
MLGTIGGLAGIAHGYTGGILLTPGLVAESFALAVVTSTLASVYPAFKASRMPIVDALRHNR